MSERLQALVNYPHSADEVALEVNEKAQNGEIVLWSKGTVVSLGGTMWGTITRDVHLGDSLAHLAKIHGGLKSRGKVGVSYIQGLHR